MQPHPATAIAPAPRAAVHPAIADTLPAQIVIVLTELFGTDLRQWHFLIDLFCDTVMQDLADLEVAIARGATSSTPSSVCACRSTRSAGTRAAARGRTPAPPASPLPRARPCGG